MILEGGLETEQAYEWAPLHLLAETSNQLPADHLATLLNGAADEPSCAIDREDDRNLGVRIPPQGMPICVDDRATNRVPFTFIYSAIFKSCLLYTSDAADE